MIPDQKVDLGSVQIHKKVIADIAAAALSEIDGVSLSTRNWRYQFLEFLGRKEFPGIHVQIDRNSQVSLELKVYIRYGINIPDMALQVQEAVRRVVERTTDINLKEVNVNIQGIVQAVERGKS